MSSIDVRDVNVIDVNEIVFGEGECLRQGYDTAVFNMFSDGDNLVIHSKSIPNLIKALNMAKELWDLDSDE